MRVVFDTNVLLDSILDRPDSEASIRLVAAAFQGKVMGIVTANSITDIYYLARKEIGDRETRQTIAEILSVLAVAPLDGDVCAAALDEPMTDYEDAILAVCAKQAGADYIATRDKKFRSAQSPVPVRTPAEIMEIIEEE